MDVQTALPQIIKWLIPVILVIAILIAVKLIRKKLRRLKSRMINRAENAIMQELSPYARDLTSGLVEAMKEATPAVRSTGGATAMCLAKVQQDFKDFHPEDADTDIQTFILEFLQVKYCGQPEFEKAKVSKKVKLNIGDKTRTGVTDVKINHIAISDYQKTLNSATLRYRVSAGFTQNGARKEKLYEVEYTLQLRDEYDASAFISCANCGAPISEADGICPYCGMKHIRDTISNWVVTDIREK